MPPDVPGREDVPGVPDDADGGRGALGPLVGGVRPFASWSVTIRRPGRTLEVGAASPAFDEVAAPAAPFSPGTRVVVDESAVLSKEVWVIVDVEADRDDCEVPPRWVSFSSVVEAGSANALPDDATSNFAKQRRNEGRSNRDGMLTL